MLTLGMLGGPSEVNTRLCYCHRGTHIRARGANIAPRAGLSRERRKHHYDIQGAHRMTTYPAWPESAVRLPAVLSYRFGNAPVPTVFDPARCHAPCISRSLTVLLFANAAVNISQAVTAVREAQGASGSHLPILTVRPELLSNGSPNGGSKKIWHERRVLGRSQAEYAPFCSEKRLA